MELNFTLLPKQVELRKLIESSEYGWIGYGGAAGGAKSYGIRAIAIILGQIRGTKSLIFRRYSKELLDNHINPMIEANPQLLDYFNKKENILYDTYGKPIIQFGYAEMDDDIFTFQGSEYDLIFVDEATQVTAKQISFLKTRNRTIKDWLKPKMILTCNPGGVSHNYIKRLFIDKQFLEYEDPKDYTFIQSHLWDNVFFVMHQLKRDGISAKEYYNWSDEQRKEYCLANADYAKTLSGLGEEKKMAYLYGDWNIFGGMFFKNFDPRKEVIEPFQIPEDWKIIGSLDPGFSSPCSFGITAQDLMGNVYRVGTYYESERPAEEHAFAIKEFLTSEYSSIYPYLKGRRPSMIVSGVDAFARKDRYAIMNSELTFSDVFQKHGLYLYRAVTDRKAGWWAWKSMMPDKYFVFDKLNVPLLSEITAVVSSSSDPEDLQGKGNDPNVSDHCVVGETLVPVEGFGLKEIKGIKVGDKVLTSFGYRDVTRKYRYENRTVYSVIINGCISLTCTDEHKIYTFEDGYVTINELKEGHTVCFLKQFRLTESSSDAINLRTTPQMGIIGVQAVTSNMVLGIFTDMFGNLVTDKRFQKVIKYTIKMGTEITITMRTLSLFLRRNMLNIILPIKKRLRSILIMSDTLQKNGIEAKKVSVGTLNMQNKLKCGSTIKSARSVVRQLKLLSEVDSAPIIVKQLHIARLLNKRTVYDITVHGVHEYYADGLLTHNSLDEQRYGIMSLFKPQEKVNVQSPRRVREDFGITEEVNF